MSSIRLEVGQKRKSPTRTWLITALCKKRRGLPMEICARCVRGKNKGLNALLDYNLTESYPLVVERNKCVKK